MIKEDFLEVHAQTLATLKAWCHWLAALHSEALRKIFYSIFNRDGTKIWLYWQYVPFKTNQRSFETDHKCFTVFYILKVWHFLLKCLFSSLISPFLNWILKKGDIASPSTVFPCPFPSPLFYLMFYAQLKFCKILKKRHFWIYTRK